MVEINYKNSTHINIKAPYEIFSKLTEYFSIRIPNIEHSSRFKMGLITGDIKFLYSNGNMLYGLKNKLIDFCKEENIEYVDNIPVIDGIDNEEFKEFLDSIKDELLFTPYNHQIKGAYKALKERRKILLSATGSGKSAILYIIIRYMIFKNLKSFIIVPSSLLTEQLTNDFYEYFYDKENKILKELESIKDELERIPLENELKKIYKSRNKYNCSTLEDYLYTISAGVDRTAIKLINISTYQSLSISQDRVNPEYFNDVDSIIIDETHRASGNTIMDILKNCSTASYRIGVTGSLGEDTIDNLKIEGSIGNVEKIITMKELTDLGMATKIIIKPIFLQYSPEFNKSIHKMSYQEEDKELRNHLPRIKFLSKLLNSFKDSNTLLIYKNEDCALQILEAHHKAVTEDKFVKTHYKKLNSRKTYWISGSTKPKDREEIRQQISKEKGSKLVAVEKIIATGANLPSLNTMILESIGKSLVLLMQAIGRVGRLDKGKDVAVIYDIVDDCTYTSKNGRGKEYRNYKLKHFFDRYNIYIAEDHYVEEPIYIKLKAEEELF